jgi:Lipase maturation factor
VTSEPLSDIDDPRAWFGQRNTYFLTRFVVLRGLGLVYFVAFLILVLQLRPLIGSEGLMPAQRFLERATQALGSSSAGFWRLPSVFWLGASDGALLALAWLGLGLSALLLAGFANSIVLGLLWALYLSFVHVGQTFWGYGWELLLCETGFLAIFMAPALALRPFAGSAPSVLSIVLLRWLCFRVMFGAGLIKVRGDPCWLDLTCLVHHYETQPNPNPLSLYLHHMPRWFHQAGVLFNHLVEIVAPFGVFGPRRVRHLAGSAIVVFQLMLIVSGNLAFLNWLTIVVALACFDDGLLQRLIPARFRGRFLVVPSAPPPESRARRVVTWSLCVAIAILSLNPIVNLLSPRQAMNRSFDPFQLVNTYGAFGSVSRERHEVVLEGTLDRELRSDTTFVEYEFPCKPGDPMRRPCLVSPYHYRLDWQMWFLALGSVEREPWVLNLVYKLLRGDPGIKALLAKDPFPDRPPRFVRARYYRYRFAAPGERGYWRRELVGEFLQPVSLADSEFQGYLQYYGFVD